MPRKSKPADTELDFSDNDTTVQENTEMTTATADGPQVTVGVAAPARTRTGAGRSRSDNPFDPIMGDLYESGEWAGVPFENDEQEQKFRNQLKNASQYAGYGLDMGVDTNEPGVLKFHIRDKVVGRGRKPGSKKIDGHFYAPDELDENGNPTDEARSAKEGSNESE